MLGRPPWVNQGCFFCINLSSSGVLCLPQSVHQSNFHWPLSLCLIPSSCKYWFSAQQTSWDYSAWPGLICSEVGGLEGHEAEMLTKCSFLLMKRFLSVSRASYLLHSFISTMGGLCSLACCWSLLFLGGCSEIKGPIYLQFLCYCRKRLFFLSFFYLEENYNLGAAALKVKIYMLMLVTLCHNTFKKQRASADKATICFRPWNNLTVVKKIRCQSYCYKMSDLFCPEAKWSTAQPVTGFTSVLMPFIPVKEENTDSCFCR